MHFRELKFWQKAKALAVSIYTLTLDGALARDFGLRDQMQRSSVSIPSNIAEGYSRESVNDRCHFITIERGSCSELQTQLEIAKDAGLIAVGVFQELDIQCEEVSRMLSGLSKSLKGPVSSKLQALS
jgi:four helix bundle protein